MTALDDAVAAYTGSSPFASGILSSDYQNNMLVPHGEQPRWWKGFDVDDDTVTGPNGETVEKGKLYLEQTIDEACFVYTEQVTKEVMDVDFGLLTKGQTQMACNPAYMEVARGDRVTLPSRLMLGRLAFTPDVGGNLLERRYVTDIVEVIASGAVVDAADYTLSALASGMGKITFNTPPAGLTLVEFHYNPIYAVLDVSDRNPPRGADGARLLQRSILTLEQKLEEPE